MQRYALGFFHLVASFFSLAINLSLIRTLYNDWKGILKVFNVRLVLSLSFSAILYTIPNFLVFLPCYFGICLYSERINTFISALNTIAYFSYQFGLLLVACERFLVFYSPNHYKRIVRISLYLIIWNWMITIIFTIVSSIDGCIKHYDDAYGGFSLDCKGSLWFSVHVFIGQIICTTMMFMYGSILIRLKSLQTLTSHVEKNNGYLALQFGFISLFSWLSGIFFLYLPSIPIANPTIMSTIFATVDIININTMPVILLFFNHTIGKNARENPTKSIAVVKSSDVNP